MRYIYDLLEIFLERIFGVWVYDEAQLDEDELLIELNDFPGDEYMISWRIVHVYKYRAKFPKMEKHIGFFANWYVPEGAPYALNTYSNNDLRTWLGSISIEDPFDWRLDACKEWEKQLRSKRLINQYIPPIIDMRQQDIEAIDHVVDADAKPITDEELTQLLDEVQGDDIITEGGEMTFQMPIEPTSVETPVFHGPYIEEELNKDYSDEDDGTMPEGVENLRKAVIGQRIIKVEKGAKLPTKPGEYRWQTTADVMLTLEDGRRVALIGVSDCCASGSVDDFIEKLPVMDHIITDVGTTESYTKWHLLTGMDDVLELDVSWSPGNPFYYAYGVEIEVFELPETNATTQREIESGE